MNENNFNNSVTTVAPVAPVVPQASVTQATPMAPAVSKKPMEKNDIMKWIGVGCGLAIVLAAFIPYMSVSIFGYTESASIWDRSKLSAIILALFGLIAAVTYFFGKGKGFSMLSAGASFWYSMTLFATADFKFDGLALGFWLMLLGGTALLVVNVLENIDELKLLVGSASNVVPKNSVAPVASAPVTPVAAPVQPVVPQAPVQPVTPVTPSVPVAPTVEPVVQQTVVCTNCGQPKKNPMDKFCQNCGQQY